MLKDLKNLEGKISIEGLDNVQNAMQARDASLSEKRLTEVKLTWSVVSHDSQDETLENAVFCELKPCNDVLTILEIVSYQGTKFPNWVGDPSFHKLVRVSIVGCRNCTSLPVLGRLQSLKELLIEGMKEVKVIGSELLGTGGVAFPSLETLRFKDMSGWRVWSTNRRDVDVVLPNLHDLTIYGCPELFDISLEAIPSLRTLSIDRCGVGVLRSIVRVASSVTVLWISRIAGLSDKVWRGVIKNLRAIEVVWVFNCNEIRYMWESKKEASKVLVNLRVLEVNGCSEFVRLGEKEEEDCRNNLLTSLRYLKLSDCENLKDCSCPGGIETLEIEKCSSITSVSFPTREGGEIEKLKQLTIEDCNELDFTLTSSLLKYVSIVSWSNLKSMSRLSNYIHLTFLRLWNCKNMISFPDIELPNLSSLTHLGIIECPSMDGHFPRGHWPPKLTTLSIGGLKKPISEWGPQNFPNSLVDLTLYGGRGEDEVRNLSGLSPHLFPSNLTTLRILEFDGLETISVGLQHLTSLQHIYISYCLILKDLPDMLLPSLLSLTITKCPKLKKNTSKRGYWPKISHIPCIEIDEELQN